MKERETVTQRISTSFGGTAGSLVTRARGGTLVGVLLSAACASTAGVSAIWSNEAALHMGATYTSDTDPIVKLDLSGNREAAQGSNQVAAIFVPMRQKIPAGLQLGLYGNAGIASCNLYVSAVLIWEV